MQSSGDPSSGGTLRSLPAGRVHVIGLAGTGMRGIVPHLLARGASVTGSDKDDSPVLSRFRKDGVECWVGHSDANVNPDTDLVLISAAVTRDNPEVRVAEKRSIQVVKYAECLGFLMGEKAGIGVAGTHGKTTTSAMVCSTLLHVGLDPSFVIGGEHPNLGGGSRSGSGPHFVAEACEFDRSFLNLRPQAAVITNVEEEHLDYFHSLVEIQDAFRSFVDLLPENGLLVYNADDPRSDFLAEARAPKQRFSVRKDTDADWWAEDIELGVGVRGQSRFVLHGPNGVTAPVTLSVPGLHNVKNALACTAACSWAGVPLERIAAALADFQGVRRRFDVLLREPSIVVDDYAHHPTEVAAVLSAARDAYPDRQIVAVFQPHQFSRLRKMLDAFGESLELADEVVVTQAYRARDSEEDVRSVRASRLAEAIRDRGKNALYAETFSDAHAILASVAQPGGVVLFMGAGSVTDLAAEYARGVAVREAGKARHKPARSSRGRRGVTAVDAG